MSTYLLSASNSLGLRTDDCSPKTLLGIQSGQRESNSHFVTPLGNGSAQGEGRTIVNKHKLRHTCVTFQPFPGSGKVNGLSRSRCPFAIALLVRVYLVVSPGGQRRWVRKSTKKRKRSEAKEILDARQKTADRAAAGTLDQARIREIVLRRSSGSQGSGPTLQPFRNGLSDGFGPRKAPLPHAQ
jgi:hypothetical protein